VKKKATDPTLLSAPPRDKREAALWKQREAEFFLPMLKQYDHQATIEFRYILNAFLAAVRSGHGTLRDGEKKQYEAWEAKLTPHDQEILYAARVARDLAIHEDGPSLGQSEAFSYIPTPGSYKHTLQLVRTDGTSVVLPAVGVASRYLGLLMQALNGYRH
jgi:hypothetical protein